MYVCICVCIQINFDACTYPMTEYRQFLRVVLRKKKRKKDIQKIRLVLERAKALLYYRKSLRVLNVIENRKKNETKKKKRKT